MTTCAVVLFVVLRETERRGWRKVQHALSECRKFALELRINLAILFGLAAIAQTSPVSIMLAGFAFGWWRLSANRDVLPVRSSASPRVFFGPMFFISLGASLDLKALSHRPALIGLSVALGLGAAVHLVPRLIGQPVPLGALASAQLGVPVAAATLGAQSHLLSSGEPAALMFGALLTIAIASLAATVVPRTTAAPARYGRFAL